MYVLHPTPQRFAVGANTGTAAVNLLRRPEDRNTLCKKRERENGGALKAERRKKTQTHKEHKEHKTQHGDMHST